MKYCPKCEEKFDAAEETCPVCGERLLDWMRDESEDENEISSGEIVAVMTAIGLL